MQVRGGASGGSGAGLLKKGEASPEEQAKELEKRVHEVLEASAAAVSKGDVVAGLEKATEAKKRERALTKFREQSQLDVNPDLTYAIDVHLASMYHLNKNYKEALDLYTGGLAWLAHLLRGAQLTSLCGAGVHVGQLHQQGIRMRR